MVSALLPSFNLAPCHAFMDVFSCHSVTYLNPTRLTSCFRVRIGQEFESFGNLLFSPVCIGNLGYNTSVNFVKLLLKIFDSCTSKIFDSRTMIVTSKIFDSCTIITLKLNPISLSTTIQIVSSKNLSVHCV